MTSSCHLVYDATTAWYSDWLLPAIGITMIVILGTIRRAERAGKIELTGNTWIIPIGFGCSIVWTALTIMATGFMWFSMRILVKSGRYVAVEGIVRNFSPGDPGDHEDESWDVRSEDSTYHYKYNPVSSTPGFRTTQPHGGPIRNGLHVRIADVGGNIGRLEICP